MCFKQHVENTFLNQRGFGQGTDKRVMDPTNALTDDQWTRTANLPVVPPHRGWMMHLPEDAWNEQIIILFWVACLLLHLGSIVANLTFVQYCYGGHPYSFAARLPSDDATDGEVGIDWWMRDDSTRQRKPDSNETKFVTSFRFTFWTRRGQDRKK